MKARVIWKGNYLEETSENLNEWPFVTLINFEGEDGKCYVSVLKENELPFKPEWNSMSLRGYHQYCNIPENISVTLQNPVVRYNGRFVETGAVFLCKTIEERNSMLC